MIVEINLWVDITYQLKPNTKILEINTLDDYLDVLDKYGYVPFPDIDTKLQLNFESISKDYDAFHITSNAICQLRFLFDGELANIAIDFYHYDVESYILFNLDCIDKNSIKTITLPDDFWIKEKDD